MGDDYLEQTDTEDGEFGLLETNDASYTIGNPGEVHRKAMTLNLQRIWNSTTSQQAALTIKYSKQIKTFRRVPLAIPNLVTLEPETAQVQIHLIENRKFTNIFGWYSAKVEIGKGETLTINFGDMRQFPQCNYELALNSDELEERLGTNSDTYSSRFSVDVESGRVTAFFNNGLKLFSPQNINLINTYAEDQKIIGPGNLVLFVLDWLVHQQRVIDES